MFAFCLPSIPLLFAYWCPSACLPVLLAHQWLVQRIIWQTLISVFATDAESQLAIPGCLEHPGQQAHQPCLHPARPAGAPGQPSPPTLWAHPDQPSELHSPGEAINHACLS